MILEAVFSGFSFVPQSTEAESSCKFPGHKSSEDLVIVSVGEWPF